MPANAKDEFRFRLFITLVNINKKGKKRFNAQGVMLEDFSFFCLKMAIWNVLYKKMQPLRKLNGCKRNCLQKSKLITIS